MKTYVIGDTHGCFDEFEKLLNKVNPNLKEDRLIMLGDYIDRGSKSYAMCRGMPWGSLILSPLPCEDKRALLM